MRHLILPSLPGSGVTGPPISCHAWVEAGAIVSPAIREAFAAVPRHRFVPRFFHRGEEHTLDPGADPPDPLAELVYSDTALVTRVEPPSSSSMPSLMARMLQALELSAGLRVLEIGAGTGYNAALIHHVTGAGVVTVEAGEATAAGAAAAIRRVGLEDAVEVVHGDGYEGHPGGAPYDRIIVTCGIAGLAPTWLDQLTEEGLVVAPVAHGGTHPVVSARRQAGTTILAGRGVTGADFMHAAGPLRPAALFPHDTTRPLPIGEAERRDDAVPALDWDAYQDLRCWPMTWSTWCGAGTRPAGPRSPTGGSGGAPRGGVRRHCCFPPGTIQRSPRENARSDPVGRARRCRPPSRREKVHADPETPPEHAALPAPTAGLCAHRRGGQPLRLPVVSGLRGADPPLSGGGTGRGHRGGQRGGHRAA